MSDFKLGYIAGAFTFGVLGLSLGMALGGFARAADFPLPKPRKPPELCLQPGRQPFPGQTLKTDMDCPTKLRWVFQH